ncbi:MAG: hypothetical protein M1814_001158 [Vezdaea aestivalis]|nr:MAG: hypothetical protein M1814_001158 [Vezdaea aestivalis]
MSGLAGHLLRRGLDSATRLEGAERRVRDFQLSRNATIALGVTMLIRYTYGEVVATLAIVETPTATVAVEVEGSDDPDAPLLGADEKQTGAPHLPELYVVKNKPITAKFRTTICHLRARGGRLARFRGLSAWLSLQFLSFYATKFFRFLIPRVLYPLGLSRVISPLSLPLATILAAVVLGCVHMTWTHVVISDPSPKPWSRRIPDRKAWLKVAPATALYALAEQITLGVPVATFAFLVLPMADRAFQNHSEMTLAEIYKSLAFRSLFVVASGLLTALLILVPAIVTLARVQASMLPEDDETIVPFDRSFGGKVVPEILGGSGKVGLLDAWKTFGWSARLRLLGVYIKTFMMETTVILSFAVFAVFQLQYFMGQQTVDDFSMILKYRLNHAT